MTVVTRSYATDAGQTRYRESIMISALWGAAALAALEAEPGAGAIMNCAAMALLLGLAAESMLSRPLAPGSERVRNTATARRVALVSLALGALATVGTVLGAWSLGLPFVAGATLVGWLILAVGTRIKPLRTIVLAETAGLGLVPQLSANSAPARIGKRVVDVLVSGGLLVVAAPVLAITALAIRRDDGGPVFFRQARVGHRGDSFDMLKFRSMVLDAEERQAELAAKNERSGPLFKMSNDPRITPVGRIIRELSIDELPQLINIFRGDMSLVGPRPALPREAALFDADLSRRTAVTPGLTGLWQAEARSDADFSRFSELDQRYLATCSPALDLWILCATATEVVTAIAAVPLRRLGVQVGAVDGVIDLRDDVVIDLRDRQTETNPSATQDSGPNSLGVA